MKDRLVRGPRVARAPLATYGTSSPRTIDHGASFDRSDREFVRTIIPGTRMERGYERHANEGTPTIRPSTRDFFRSQRVRPTSCS
jgi:hypothetical protein